MKKTTDDLEQLWLSMNKIRAAYVDFILLAGITDTDLGLIPYLLLDNKLVLRDTVQHKPQAITDCIRYGNCLANGKYLSSFNKTVSSTKEMDIIPVTEQ